MGVYYAEKVAQYAKKSRSQRPIRYLELFSTYYA